MRYLFQSTVCATIFLWLATPCLEAQGLDLSKLSQTPIIRSWGTESGLPQNTVNAIVQDPDGYMWLGTRDGLARFDGVRFKVFGLENGLPSVDISCLLEDHLGFLWIGTYGAGLCRMKQGRIEIMADPGRHPGSDTITCLQEDSTGPALGGNVRRFAILPGWKNGGRPRLQPALALANPLSAAQPGWKNHVDRERHLRPDARKRRPVGTLPGSGRA